MKINPYTILNLSEGASSDEIRKAYRKLAFLYHPDRNPGDKFAARRFQYVSEAYAELTSPPVEPILPTPSPPPPPRDFVDELADDLERQVREALRSVQDYL